MTIFCEILRFFIFSILDTEGPKFYEFGSIVAETNGAHPGSPKMVLLTQGSEFFLEIFSTQSALNILDHPVARKRSYTQRELNHTKIKIQ